jgi:uncharacterized membrane protein
MTSSTIQPSGAGAPAAPRASSETRLWLLALLCVTVAMFTSGYLSYTKLFPAAMLCAESSVVNCNAVTSSRWGYLFGVPVAYIGFASYITLFVLLNLERRVAFLRQNGLYIIFGLILFDFLFHCYLTYNSLFSLRMICLWCIATHIMATLALIFTALRLYRRMGAVLTPAA